MKKILFLILTLLMCGAAMAQNLEDVVYLKSGGVVRGTLIEQVPNIKIRTASGNLMTIVSDDIDHIAQETKLVAGNESNMYNQRDIVLEGVESSKRRRAASDLNGGIRLLAGLTLQQRPSKYNCGAISMDISMGKQIKPCFYLGAGLSDEILLDYWYYGFLDQEPTPVAQMPVFVHARYDARPGDGSPMADLRLGYSMTVDEYVDYSGIYINPSVGYRLGRMTLSLGLELVKLNQAWDFQVVGSGGTLDRVEVKFQKSLQLRFTLEWGGRK